jgi:hypothetical protein
LVYGSPRSASITRPGWGTVPDRASRPRAVASRAFRAASTRTPAETPGATPPANVAIMAKLAALPGRGSTDWQINRDTRFPSSAVQVRVRRAAEQPVILPCGKLRVKGDCLAACPAPLGSAVARSRTARVR